MKKLLMAMCFMLMGSAVHAAEYDCMVTYGQESGMATVTKDGSEMGTTIRLPGAGKTAVVSIKSSLNAEFQDIIVDFGDGEYLVGMTASNQSELLLLSHLYGKSAGINCELK